MINRTVTILTFLLIPMIVGAKSDPKSNRFLVSFEPNVMLANRTYSNLQKDTSLFVKNRNALGFSVGTGYQHQHKHLFIKAELRFLLLRNGIRLDYNESGFNSTWNTTQKNENKIFTYTSAQGITITGGYIFNLARRSDLFLGIGGHIDHTFTTTSMYKVITSGGDTNSPNFQDTYTEYVHDYPRFNYGADFSATYSFGLGRLNAFTGFHYAYVPGQRITADFTSFNGLGSANNGQVSISRSYTGLTLGFFFGGENRKIGKK